jgi:pimeloyl-ACP methyl ester carboxylesterase
MLRLIFLLMLLAAPAGAALPRAEPLHPSTAFQPRGPEQARGALVWLHGSYDADAQKSPPEPAWVRRAADRGYDIWRFDRLPGRDSLAVGAEQLAAGLAALRQGGYQRIVVAGHSRGAWIALTVLSHPGLADGVAAFSPAAHGTSPERRPKALEDFDALMHAAGHAPNTRLVIAQFAGDPLDPDPQMRQDMIRDAARHQALKLQPIFQPDQPRGHYGVYEPEFDKLFGARIVRFLDPEARRSEPRQAESVQQAPP